VQGLARGLGVTEPVTSPTFSVYNLHRGTQSRLLVHLDAYRLDSPEQLEALMIDDFIQSPYCLAVEWPEHVAAWLPPGAIHLELSITPDGKHQLKFRAA
jgi:tRNA threonylcarbamoyladenosine biosynthesis protein TsaE